VRSDDDYRTHGSIGRLYESKTYGFCCLLTLRWSFIAPYRKTASIRGFPHDVLSMYSEGRVVTGKSICGGCGCRRDIIARLLRRELDAFGSLPLHKNRASPSEAGVLSAGNPNSSGSYGNLVRSPSSLSEQRFISDSSVGWKCLGETGLINISTSGAACVLRQLSRPMRLG
jgi:hypothetical protein